MLKELLKYVDMCRNTGFICSKQMNNVDFSLLLMEFLSIISPFLFGKLTNVGFLRLRSFNYGYILLSTSFWIHENQNANHWLI